MCGQPRIGFDKRGISRNRTPGRRLEVSMPSKGTRLESRAAASAYLALGGPCLLLSIIGGIIAWKHPERELEAAAATVFSVGALWVIWLSGFRIRITGQKIEYRNGCYRLVALSLHEVIEVKRTWIEWSTFCRRVQVPRLVVVGSTGRFIAINPKPFKRQDLQRVTDLIDEAKQGTNRSSEPDESCTSSARPPD